MRNMPIIGVSSFMSGSFLAGAAAMALLSGNAHAADKPFYDGKTITVIVGTVPGGSSDVSCRLIAQYLASHVAGEPTIIVKNMPSADNILATNYVALEAKNDGLTMRCGSIAPSNQSLGVPGLKVDLTKMNYILGDGGPEVMYVRSDVTPGIKTAQDIFKAQGLVLSGFAVDSAKDLSERTLLETAGIDKYKYVTGFQGGGAVSAAFQQKFVNLAQDSELTYVTVRISTSVKTGEAIPLYQTGVADANGEMTARDAQLPDVPSFAEFYKAKFGKMPSGPSWDLGSAILLSNNVALTSLALPPGAPPNAVAAMRDAVGPLNQDPDFITAVEKLHGKGARETGWQEVTKRIDALAAMKPDTLAYFKHEIETGREMQQSNSQQK